MSTSTTAAPPTGRDTAVMSCVGMSAGYADRAAVHDLSIHVDPGEIVALLGANGAGKSTTLLTLAGALAPLSGDVRWQGVSTRASLARRARNGLGLLTEERSVFMGLTVLENLRLGRGDVDAALDLFEELKPHRDRPAGLLSGGQQQMLSLARVLAAAPQAVLADELSLGLAPLIVQRLLNALRTAADERNAGVLLVEQHITLALKFADRVYVLNRGRCVLEGTAADVGSNLEEIERLYLAGPAP